MEVLGFEDTPESQFRDQNFIKSQHPGFVDLLDGNKFLGVGDNYLRSDQIVKVRLIKILSSMHELNTFVARPFVLLFVVQVP